MSVSRAAMHDALCGTLERTEFAQLGSRTEGKVRDSYVTADNRRVLITTDRVSAFDRILGTLPLKGQMLNHIAAWWFRSSSHIAPNHLIDCPDPNVTIARECAPLDVEFVVRGYVTGVTATSIWTHYKEGKRDFCGHRLPDGLRKNEKLPRPLLTPSTKAEKGGHDVSLSREQLVDSGAITARDYDEAAEHVLALFAFGQAVCEERGLILVDTKYELGRTPEGTLVVIDEMHTPDSSRFWRRGTYDQRVQEGKEPDSLDKEYLRRWLAEAGYRGTGAPPVLPDAIRVEASMRYLEACESITGADLELDLRPPLPRIARALHLDTDEPAPQQPKENSS